MPRKKTYISRKHTKKSPSSKTTGKQKNGYKRKFDAAPHHKSAFSKPGNFLYPIPAVMVSLADREGKTNIITIAWTGTICSDPPMVSISVRPERYSYSILKDTGEFVINLTTEDLVPCADFCGVRSGRSIDKFKECGLTPGKADLVSAPTIEESPVSLECRITDIIPLGTHDLFLAKILNVQVDKKYLDKKGKFRMEDIGLTAYSHGTYYGLGKALGTFGFSVKKKKKKKENQ